MKSQSFKKLIIGIFSIFLSLVSCGKKESGDEHVHTFAPEYAWNNTEHYHPATCGDFNLKQDIEKHDFDKNGTCKVCKFQKQNEIERDEDLGHSRVGYQFEYLGYTSRTIPTEVKNEGIVTTVDSNDVPILNTVGPYPTYGKRAPYSTTQKNQNNEECSKLNPQGGTYDLMDKNGNLYKLDSQGNKQPVIENGIQRKLYKHTSSIGMYYGNVSDTEKAVIKKVTYQPKSSVGYNLTGLYACPGEVIDIQFNSLDYERLKNAKGLTIYIGQALNNGQENNIWDKREYNRMSVILSKFQANEKTLFKDDNSSIYHLYIGSHFGGPIFIKTANNTITSMTIKGAVNYRHFILGYTTRDEFEMLSQSSAPYFDLEVWDSGVVIGGPSIRANGFTYDDLYKAAIFWEKTSIVSNRVSFQGSIVFIFDCFVAAGAAVAFPGRRSVNCPDGWMSQALNYNTLVTSGCWGNIHEYNHNFQSNWGMPGQGEVTNNALNLVAYTSFTNISQSRTFTSSGEGGLSGWNPFTSASHSLRQLLNKTDVTDNADLNVYASLIHNVGQKSFINAARNQKGNSIDKSMISISNETGMDLTYFYKDIAKLNASENAINEIKSKNLPKFLPISSIYQTGRSSLENGKKIYTDTQRPFIIPYGEDYTLDFSKYRFDDNNMFIGGSVVIPNGFNYEIKNVSSPQYGNIYSTADKNIFIYHPDKSHLDSGKFYVTLSITGPLSVEDVELVIQLKQTKESIKNRMEVTTYKYPSSNNETNKDFEKLSAKQAYEQNFQGSSKEVNSNYINPNVPNKNQICQNCNSEIWLPKENNNCFMELKGKIYLPNDGDYRIALRGRKSIALYISLNSSDNYLLAASALKTNNLSSNFTIDDPNTYYDLLNMEAGTWVYYKAILKVDYASAFIGVGLGEFSEPILKEDQNGVPYYDYSNRTCKVNYVTSYNQGYEFEDKKDFESEYLFDKEYDPSYYFENSLEDKGSLVSITGFEPWDSTTGAIDNLFDEDETNEVHSCKNKPISEDNPFDLTVDMGKSITANQIKMTGFLRGSQDYLPKDFKLLLGDKKDDLTEVLNLKNCNKDSNNNPPTQTFSFEKNTFRYYRLIVTKTRANNSQYIGFKTIKFKDITSIKTDENHQGYLMNLSSPIFQKNGNFVILNEPSKYGFLYKAYKGSTIQFRANIDRFTVKLKDSESSNIECKIDNKTVSLVDNSQENKNLPLLSNIITKKKNATDVLIKITFKEDTKIEYLSLFYLPN